MRRLILTAVLGCCCLTSATGCLIPMYNGDPGTRTEELIFTSENLRVIMDEWRRIWFLDMPSTLSPDRTYGGII